LLPWLLGLPMRIWNLFWSLSTTLSGRGGELLQGFKDGIVDKWDGTLKPWLADLWQKIKTAVGNLGRTLWNAGWKVIQGFKDGMVAAWNGVTSWLSGLKNVIPDWKGPLREDLKILVNNGEAIMIGLQRGMEIGFNDKVIPMLQQFGKLDIPEALQTKNLPIPQFSIPASTPSVSLPSTTVQPGPTIVNVFLDGELVTEQMLERTGLNTLPDRIRTL